DEMWTGFRFALGGAQERFGVQADLMCYSKAIANGMPLAVLAGRADVMRLCEKNVFFFTTFGGEALSLAAAKATIHELRDCSVPAYLARQGRVLRDGYDTVARHLDMPYTQAIGADCRSLVTFDARAGDPLEMKSLVQQELLARGILWSGFHNMSFSHTDADVAHALAAYREALMVLKQAVESGSVRQGHLGSRVEPVFRRTSNATAKRNRTGPFTVCSRTCPRSSACRWQPSVQARFSWRCSSGSCRTPRTRRSFVRGSSTTSRCIPSRKTTPSASSSSRSSSRGSTQSAIFRDFTCSHTGRSGFRYPCSSSPTTSTSTGCTAGSTAIGSCGASTRRIIRQRR